MASVLRMSFMSVFLATCLVPIGASLPGFAGFPKYAAIRSMITHSINKAMQELAITKQLEKQYLLSGMRVVPRKRFTHAYHTADPSSITTLSDKSFISVKATKELVRLTNTPLYLLQSNPDVTIEWQRQISPHCNIPVAQCNQRYMYRTTEGTCNNLQNTKWGSSMAPYLRYIPAAYDNGIDIPRQHGRGGNLLPGPRVISNILHNTGRSEPDEGGRSVLFMSWGTFAVLDLVRTPVSKGFDNSDISCCPPGGATADQVASCFPIKIPRGDLRFKSNCMNFVRSQTAPTQSCDMGVRQQLNEQSSFMDASMVYGSTQAILNRLRSGRGGLMKMTMTGLLPPASDESCTLSGPGEFCFDAGAPRNSLVPSFAAVFTLGVREHNRIAKQLNRYNPHWSDEKLFQETRKIVIAIIQHINYNEFLPHVLSNAHMREYGLFSTPKGHRTVYNPNVNPTIGNVFGVAAFRFGHSLIPDLQGMKEAHSSKSVVTPIEFTYLRPAMLFADNGRGVDKVNIWQLHSKQAKSDRFLQNGVRNELLLDEMGVALDLAATNIQRGRDHGMASYNAWRKWCGLQPANHFSTSLGGLIDIDPLAADLLSKVYRHPDDIDLFTGGLSEMKIKGTLTGPTFSCIISKQFEVLKKGDRFWYESDDPIVRFTTAQLNEIKKVRVSQIMCANTAIQKIQQHAFLVPSLTNRMVPCELLPTIDLRHWIETPNQQSQAHRFRIGYRLNNRVIVPYNPVRLWAYQNNMVLPASHQIINL
ncbi:chorion peroxidase-like [Mizuhopecten yessoensis]|uniref:Chorion peroxidase n=1 Tax=Mizuhopecten yessoensis TaxID=6573 RepID=A0A210Q743_MIZYE|nr:chorion peroxidase-like [Mizuhopecten yessoensis]OWF44554.1 Chorion peroxidase [Mizuhopecten yessoensis]